jgi:hypothetical protein
VFNIVPPRYRPNKSIPAKYPRLELAIFLAAVGFGSYPFLNLFLEPSLTVVDDTLVIVSVVLFVVFFIVASGSDGPGDGPRPVIH